MARRLEKEAAIKLRKAGKSYSQIKQELGISKSTLSGWLSDIPLSKKQMTELQYNESVIEKIRYTKLQTRNARLTSVFCNAKKEIGTLSKREFFIAGFFLYWAEGGKTTPYTITLSNTDPSMIRAYIKWLDELMVPRDKLIVRLHLYADMNVTKEVHYWSREIAIHHNHFRKPYVKKTKLSDLTYISRGHGTCNIIVQNRDIAERVHQGLLYVRQLFT